MTDQKRDPEAIGPEGAMDETEAAADAAADTDESADYTDEAFEADDDVDAAADVAPAGVAASAAGRRSRDRRAKTVAPVAPPSISEQAVHINDRASAVFVLAMIGVFVAIFGYALLFGQGGFVSNMLPTPTPVITPAPTATPTADPSASASAAPSASASAAPSVTPAPSPSAVASPSPAAS
jgi:hypothetical protein